MKKNTNNNSGGLKGHSPSKSQSLEQIINNNNNNNNNNGIEVLIQQQQLQYQLQQLYLQQQQQQFMQIPLIPTIRNDLYNNEAIPLLLTIQQQLDTLNNNLTNSAIPFVYDKFQQLYNKLIEEDQQGPKKENLELKTKILELEQRITKQLNQINELEIQNVSKSNKLQEKETSIDKLINELKQNANQTKRLEENHTILKKNKQLFEADNTQKVAEISKLNNQIVSFINNEKILNSEINNQSIHIKNMSKMKETFETNNATLKKQISEMEIKISQITDAGTAVPCNPADSVTVVPCNPVNNNINKDKKTTGKSKTKSKNNNLGGLKGQSPSASPIDELLDINDQLQEKVFLNESVIDNLRIELDGFKIVTVDYETQFDKMKLELKVHQDLHVQDINMMNKLIKDKEKVSNMYIQAQKHNTFLTEKYRNSKIMASKSYLEAIEELYTNNNPNNNYKINENKIDSLTSYYTEMNSDANVAPQAGVERGEAPSFFPHEWLHTKLKAQQIVAFFTSEHELDIRLIFMKLISNRSDIFIRQDDLERTYNERIQYLENQLDYYRDSFNQYKRILKQELHKIRNGDQVDGALDGLEGAEPLQLNFSQIIELQKSSNTELISKLTELPTAEIITNLVKDTYVKRFAYLEVVSKKHKKIYQQLKELDSRDYLFFYNYLLPNSSQEEREILQNIVNKHNLFI